MGSMTAEEHNLVLEHLRHIRARVDRTAEDVQDLKVRMASIETKLAHMHADDVNQIHRIDRIEVRLERIEQRLDLYDPKH